MVKSLSVLIFSKNNVEDALIAVRNTYDIADEIVIIDSSDKDKYAYLNAEKIKRGLKKLKIYYAISLGYVEAMREYGVLKCESDWILYLDSDETISDAFRSDIRNIINETDCHGFLIDRINHVPKFNVTYRCDYQLRLYKKNSVEYQGTMSELPIIKGKLEKLSKKYYLEQTYDYDSRISKMHWQLFPIDSYENRIRYKDLEEIFNKRAVTKPLSMYLSLKNPKPYSEISHFDYTLYALLGLKLHVIESILTFNFPSIYELKYAWFYNSKKIDFFFKTPKKERELQLGIMDAEKKAGGVIKYLGLNSEKTMKYLDKKYKNSKMKSVDLFLYLLRKKYEDGRI